MLEKLLEGSILMVIGMGVVICFLFIMIFSMRIMSNAISYLNKIFPEKIEEISTKSKRITANVDEAIALAFAAIIAKKN